jgi:dTDP-4-dehydrorhamnose reductase
MSQTQTQTQTQAERIFYSTLNSPATKSHYGFYLKKYQDKVKALCNDVLIKY